MFAPSRHFYGELLDYSSAVGATRDRPGVPERLPYSGNDVRLPSVGVLALLRAVAKERFTGSSSNPVAPI
jgi:hypothetical protein